MKGVFFIISTLVIGSASMLTGQAVTAFPSSIKFDTSLTTVTDSVSLWISNKSSTPVSVTDINIYGGVFSPRDTAFTVKANDSVRTWIRFASNHNLTYNDVAFIETDFFSGTVVVPLTGTKKYSEPLYAATQGKSGELLKTALNTISKSGQTTLGYTTARDRMYGNIDNIAGEVECIYTGRKATFNTRLGATSNNFNCEHTWPQSKFSEADPMVSDIHHLFSSDETANSKRSNYPFGVVVTSSWNVGGSKYGSGYGGQTVFEPRDEHKGDCARAMFYFITRYPNNYGSFWGESPYQEMAFRDWNTRFPPTARSKSRNNGVQQYQGNRNPFIDHPEFIDRINSFTGTATVVTAPRLVVSSERVRHAAVAVGAKNNWKLAIANIGTASLTITSAVFSSPFYSFIDSLTDIESNGYRTVGISYAPTVATTDSLSTLTFTYSDGTSTKNVIVTITASSLSPLSVRSEQKQPDGYFLGQNYPNPFNPTTQILFTLPAAGFTTLSVHSLLGLKVAALLNERMEAGEHHVSFDAAALPSGLYIYTLQSGRYTESKKMLLLK